MYEELLTSTTNLRLAYKQSPTIQDLMREFLTQTRLDGKAQVSLATFRRRLHWFFSHRPVFMDGTSTMVPSVAPDKSFVRISDDPSIRLILLDESHKTSFMFRIIDREIGDSTSLKFTPGDGFAKNSFIMRVTGHKKAYSASDAANLEYQVVAKVRSLQTQTNVVLTSFKDSQFVAGMKYVLELYHQTPMQVKMLLTA